MNNLKPWGKSLALDLYNCNKAKLTDPALLEKFIKDVIVLIDMKAHGPTYIDRFGDDHVGEGYSAMQFIETSSITVHLDEISDRAFIDIFSCKDFDDKKAAEFAKNFFEAKDSKATALTR